MPKFVSKETKTLVLESARDVLLSALDQRDLELIKTQFTVLSNDLYFLTSDDWLRFIEVAGEGCPTDRWAVKSCEKVLFHLIERGDTDPPLELVTNILYGLAYFQDGAGLERFLKLVITQNLPLSPSYIEVLMRFYSTNGPVASAEKLVDYCIDNGLGTQERFFSLLIDTYAYAKQPWKCMEALRKCEGQGHPFTIALLSRVVRAFGEAKEPKGIEMVEMLVETKQLKRSMTWYNMLLNAYKKNRQFRQGIETFELMVKESATDPLLVPSYTTLSIVMDMFVTTGRMPEAVAILETAIASDLRLDSVIFNTVLNGFRKQKKSTEVLYYYELMQNCGIRPTSETYSILYALTALDNRQFIAATAIYDEMMAIGLQPNRAMVGQMITAALLNGQHDKAKAYYASLKERGMTPSAQILCSMMQLAVAVAEDDSPLEDAVFYFELARRLGVVDEPICRMLAFVKLLLGEPLEAVMEAYMVDLRRTGLNPTDWTLHMFAAALLRPLTFKENDVIRPTIIYTEPAKGEVASVRGRKVFEELVEAVKVRWPLKTKDVQYFERIAQCLL